jgi:zinc transport system ATP-binding protein
MSEPLIAADRLSVHAGGAHILDRVSLAVHPREIVTLIGPNGSGKTTLLKAILGLMRAEGEITRRPGLKIGYVPQQFERDASLPLTVAGFLGLFAPAKAAEAALARVGIAQAKNRQLGALSGGELARVLLARAIASRPDLLVLDEPMAGVDVAGEAALYHLIAEIRDELGCGVLLVSHDLHVVMAQADRVVCLNRHVCCEGDAHTVVRDPAFLELFGARAASELALYAHHHDHAHGPAGETQPVRNG